MIGRDGRRSRAPRAEHQAEGVLQGCRSGIARPDAHARSQRRHDLGRYHGDHRQTDARRARPRRAPGVVARTAYTTAHKTTWDRMVSGYLVTKAIAGGDHADGRADGRAGSRHRAGRRRHRAADGCGRLLGLTAALLLVDLEAAGRFYFLLTRVELRLVAGQGRLRAGVFAACVLCGSSGSPTPGALKIVAIPQPSSAPRTAGYTAFLFAQCEGRDLWQTPLLLPMLLARAVDRRCVGVRILDVFMDIPSHRAVWWVLLGAWSRLRS